MSDVKKAGSSSPGEVTLSEMKKEVIDGRNLTIKTNNLIQNLGAQLKEIEKKLKSLEKKSVFTSVSTYVIFLVILGFGFYRLSEERVKSVSAELDIAKKHIADYDKKFQEIEQEKDERRKNERVLEEVQALFAQDRLEEGITKWKKIDESKLPPFLVKLAKNELNQAVSKLSEDLFKRATGQANSRNYKAAADSLEKIIKIDSRPEFAVKALMKLGEVQEKAKQYKDSAEAYKRVADEYGTSESAGEALWLYAKQMESLDEFEQAAIALEKLVEKYPDNSYAKQAKPRIDSLRRRTTQGTSTPPTATTPEPAKPVVTTPSTTTSGSSQVAPKEQKPAKEKEPLIEMPEEPVKQPTQPPETEKAKPKSKEKEEDDSLPAPQRTPHL